MEALDGNIVRAIDVGYGNVKYITSHNDAFSKIECAQFPSRSPIAGDKGISAGLLKARNTVVVNVNGTDYEVGPDVSKAQGTFDESSVLDKGFSLTDAYLARLRGAIYYMKGDPSFNKERLALLVIGLPVSIYRQKELHPKIKERIVGMHELPNNRSVFVENVLIMPQPLGAFFEYAFENGMFESMREQNNLIVDPGFFTFDWLFSSALVVNPIRSDSVNRCMSAIIKAIAEDANKKEGWGTDIGMLIRLLEEHFRTGKAFNVFGQDIDVSKYIASGRAIANEAVAALSNSVGDGADIQNIILGGGGAPFFIDALQEKFHRHKILVMENPVFSNVRGFQLAGEQQLLKALRANRKSSK